MWLLGVTAAVFLLRSGRQKVNPLLMHSLIQSKELVELVMHFSLSNIIFDVVKIVSIWFSLMTKSSL